MPYILFSSTINLSECADRKSVVLFKRRAKSRRTGSPRGFSQKSAPKSPLADCLPSPCMIIPTGGPGGENKKRPVAFSPSRPSPARTSAGSRCSCRQRPTMPRSAAPFAFLPRDARESESNPGRAPVSTGWRAPGEEKSAPARLCLPAHQNAFSPGIYGPGLWCASDAYSAFSAIVPRYGAGGWLSFLPRASCCDVPVRAFSRATTMWLGTKYPSYCLFTNFTTLYGKEMLPVKDFRRCDSLDFVCRVGLFGGFGSRNYCPRGGE